MRWRQSRASQNVEDYRGRRTGGGGGGMKFGIVGLVAIVGAYFLGIDPRLIMGLLGGGTGAPTTEATRRTWHARGRGRAVRRARARRHRRHLERHLRRAGEQYPAPRLALFSRRHQHRLWFGHLRRRAFLLPGATTRFTSISPSSASSKPSSPRKGDFAKAYVIAHEVGHHVQTVTGTSEKVRAAQQRASESDANALQVKMELQADCYAGIWAHHADRARQLVESGDIDEALGAASAVGDDTIQKRVQGHVNQESFTHGSGAQRQQWFRKGYGSGLVQDCDTFQ